VLAEEHLPHAVVIRPEGRGALGRRHESQAPPTRLGIAGPSAREEHGLVVDHALEQLQVGDSLLAVGLLAYAYSQQVQSAKDKEAAAEELAKNIKRLAEQQHLLYAENRRAVLIVSTAT